jgi:lipopolysaccharide assembly outer membrane protein LptD (OstA)
VRKEQKKIQAFLFVVGVLLILITYFYYPYKNKTLVEKDIQENVPPISDDLADKSTSFESLVYKGLYDLNKTFLVKSKKAHIKENEPNIVYMTNMHVILYLTDGRVVNIKSDKGTYNKANYDCFFEQNVKASDGETKIFSENLELLGDKSIVKIYNNVVVNYPTGSFIQADKIDYNFETKYFKVSMFDDKRIKMKVLNE